MALAGCHGRQVAYGIPNRAHGPNRNSKRLDGPVPQRDQKRTASSLRQTEG